MKALDEAIANMGAAHSSYYKEYVFYMYMLSQCRIVQDESLPAAAGVLFKNDHYILYLNPKENVSPDVNKPIQGFCEAMPLEHRIGILAHEMSHIALGHTLRKEDRNHQIFNYATDCALNQQITRKHLPDYAIYPDNFPNRLANNHWNESAEFYYDLLKDQIENLAEEGEQECGCSVDANGKGQKLNTGKLLDDHSLWQQSSGDADIQKELTKNMVEKAGDATVKARGNLPSNYSKMIDNLTVRKEVDWKKVLRKIVGNKKANKRKTLLRRDRRLPYANWIKGTTKDRVFDLAVISDVSGSVSDDSLYEVWGEIINICNNYSLPVTMVQVDTQPSKPEELTKNSKIIERKACGGTYLSPALDMLNKHNINYNALVVTTDGYLCESDIIPFAELKVPVIWLIDTSGTIMDSMNTGKMKAIQLTNKGKK